MKRLRVIFSIDLVADGNRQKLWLTKGNNNMNIGKLLRCMVHDLEPKLRGNRDIDLRLKLGNSLLSNSESSEILKDEDTVYVTQHVKVTDSDSEDEEGFNEADLTHINDSDSETEIPLQRKRKMCIPENQCNKSKRRMPNPPRTPPSACVALPVTPAQTTPMSQDSITTLCVSISTLAHTVNELVHSVNELRHDVARITKDMSS